VSIDPNAIINSPAPALFLALVLLGLFITAVIVPGRLVDAILLRFDRMAAAFEERNRIDDERQKWEREHDERRGAPRPGRG